MHIHMHKCRHVYTYMICIWNYARICVCMMQEALAEEVKPEGGQSFQTLQSKCLGGCTLYKGYLRMPDQGCTSTANGFDYKRQESKNAVRLSCYSRMDDGQVEFGVNVNSDILNEGPMYFPLDFLKFLTNPLQYVTFDSTPPPNKKQNVRTHPNAAQTQNFKAA